jgi:hypothetical protein
MGREHNNSKEQSEAATKICPVCGYKGKAVLKLKGHASVEIILWILLVIPGFIYSIWRHSSPRHGCPKCISDTMIPLYTPEGQKISEKFNKVSIDFLNQL